MSLASIRAEFACDGCGRPFSVAIDPASTFCEGWTAFDMAEDAAMGSISYHGPPTREGFEGMSSVQGDQHLCGSCTSIADANKED